MNAPDHLDEPARTKFAELLPVLEQIHTKVDQATLDGLSCYCCAWSRWVSAETEVSKLGVVVKSPSGFPTVNPYAAVGAAAQRAMRQWGAALGLDPTSRRKITKKAKAAEAPKPQGSTLLADLLTGNGKGARKAAARN